MTPEEISKLKNLKGETRGVTLQTDANYVREKMGEAALLRLQKKTKELGWEIDYPSIKTMGWYPVGLRAISLLAAEQCFGWTDEEIKEVGNNAPKYSFIANTMLRYFLSVERVFKEASRYWKKHYTLGELDSPEISEEKKFGILQLKGFNVHPILCPYLAGYFLRISQFVIKSEKITIQETDCAFNGDRDHKFLVKWE